MKKLKPGKHLKPLVMLLYALIFGAVGLIIVAIWAAPPAAPGIYLTPEAQTLPANTTFTVAVREVSGTTAVNAVQANISYPDTLLEFVSIDGSTSAFGTQAESTGGAGSIRIARGTTTPVTGDQLVANITFRTRTTTGVAALAFTTGTAVTNSTTNTDILGSLARTFGASFTVDVSAPTVSVTAPTAGSVIAAGSTTQISVSASDNTAVSGVTILVDGVVRTTLSASPYNYSWNTSGLSLGSHTVQARANDAYGNTATSALVTVTLSDLTAPSVSVTAPAANATVSGNVTFSASTSDNTGGTGVNRVEFFVDGVLRNTDTTSPYSFSWDSRTVADGSHSLVARAYDNASPSNSANSSAISVTVDNADHTAPTQPSNLTVSARTYNSITLTWSASTDNVGVTGYRIQRNGNTITTTNSTTLTYTHTGLNENTSYNFSVAAVDGNNNFSTAATVTSSTLRRISGDLNTDGTVNVFDLSMLLARWQTADTTADLNGNGTVDIFDLSVLLTNWGS